MTTNNLTYNALYQTAGCPLANGEPIRTDIGFIAANAAALNDSAVQQAQTLFPNDQKNYIAAVINAGGINYVLSDGTSIVSDSNNLKVNVNAFSDPNVIAAFANILTDQLTYVNAVIATGLITAVNSATISSMSTSADFDFIVNLTSFSDLIALNQSFS